jgi:hypothetical protein
MLLGVVDQPNHKQMTWTRGACCCYPRRGWRARGVLVCWNAVCCGLVVQLRPVPLLAEVVQLPGVWSLRMQDSRCAVSPAADSASHQLQRRAKHS